MMIFEILRALLHIGRLSNFILEAWATKLEPLRCHSSVCLEDIYNTYSFLNKENTKYFNRSLEKPKLTFSFETLILPKICLDQPRLDLNNIKNL